MRKVTSMTVTVAVQHDAAADPVTISQDLTAALAHLAGGRTATDVLGWWVSTIQVSDVVTGAVD